MRWILSWRADPRARAIADRHYNRQKIGAPQFVPPGRCLVLLTKNADALWITSFQEFVMHEWPGAWVCSAFRNESSAVASTLIVEAVAATRAYFGEPPSNGMITFVNPTKVRRTRQPGRCFLKAGFRYCGRTAGGLVAMQLEPPDMPPALSAIGSQSTMFGEI